MNERKDFEEETSWFKNSSFRNHSRILLKRGRRVGFIFVGLLGLDLGLASNSLVLKERGNSPPPAAPWCPLHLQPSFGVKPNGPWCYCYCDKVRPKLSFILHFCCSRVSNMKINIQDFCLLVFPLALQLNLHILQSYRFWSFRTGNARTAAQASETGGSRSFGRGSCKASKSAISIARKSSPKEVQYLNSSSLFFVSVTV